MPSAIPTPDRLSGTWRELFERAGYVRYFGTVALARSAGTMFNVGAVLLVLQRTGSLSLAGLTAAAGSLPAGLTGPFLGAWLDVARSRRLLIALDQLGTVIALAGMLALAGHAPAWVIPLLGLVYGVTRPLSSGAFYSVLPELVGSDLLAKANTMEATSVNLAFVAGPAVAGLVAGAASPAAAVETELGLTLLVVALVLTNGTFELRPRSRPERVTRLLGEGFNALWTIPALRAGAASAALSVVGWGALNVGFPAYAQSVHVGAHASGYMWAALSLGSIVSAFAFTAQAARLSTIALTAGSLLLMGLSAALWPLAGNLASALALVTLTGLLEGPALAAFFTVRQRHTPPQIRAQVFATVASMQMVGTAVGSALAGPVHGALGTTATLLIFTVFEVAAAAAMLSGAGSLQGTASHA